MRKKMEQVQHLIDRSRHDFVRKGTIANKDLRALRSALSGHYLSKMQRADALMLLAYTLGDEELLPRRFGLYDMAKKADPSSADSVNVSKAIDAFDHGVATSEKFLKNIRHPNRLGHADKAFYWMHRLLIAKARFDWQAMSSILANIPREVKRGDLLAKDVAACRQFVRCMRQFHRKRQESKHKSNP